MKLSASAKEYVMADVARAFAKEMKAAEDAVGKIEKAKNDLWNDFHDAMERHIEKAREACRKEMEKRKLTFSRGAGDDDRKFFRTYLDQGDIAETATSGYWLPDDCDLCAARAARTKVEQRIREASQKALYRIEVGGTKKTIDDIIRQVVDETRKEME